VNSLAAVPERLAVIGGDAAGMSAASVAHRRDPDLEVVAFERGAYTSYSACGIPYFVAGTVGESENLIARSPDEFREQGIAVHTRTEVVGVDLDRRELTVRELNGGRERQEGFDQLVYATGAEASVPPVTGAEVLEPVLKIEPAERLSSALHGQEGKHALVIGASYLGLEMAEALISRGLEVTLIDMAEQVMGSLDTDMAAHMQDAAEGLGIRVRLSTALEEVLLDENDHPRAVRTSDGEIRADFVLPSAGLKPLTELAEAAGLELGDTGALRVDDHQRCPGHDGVFAAGDCVESWHRLLERPVNIKLGTHANKQGWVAGSNITGGDFAFPGVIGTAVSKICHQEVGRTGLSESEARDAGIDYVTATIRSTTRAAYFPGAGPIWVKLLADPSSGRLLGGQIVGVEGAAKRIDVLATCVWTGLPVQEMQLLDLSYAPPFSGVYDPVLIAARQVAKKVTG